MVDADSIRSTRWLDPDDVPEEPDEEPTEEELAERVNDHVLRAWDYLADNSEAIDTALEGLILNPNKQMPVKHLLAIKLAMTTAVHATETKPVDAKPSLYWLLKAAMFLIEGQLVSGNLNEGLTEQMSDWMRDAKRYFTKTT